MPPVRIDTWIMASSFFWSMPSLSAAQKPISRNCLSASLLISLLWPVGAAWYRLFTKDEPGYGFVDEETPELSIAVVPSKRARGHGFMLLKALMERAREDGFDRLSLSVEPDNPSIALYEKFGFRRVGERNGTTTMVADLNAQGRIAVAADRPG